MAQDVQGVLAAVQVGGAHIALVVLRRKAPLPGDGQRLPEGGGGAGAKGRAGGGGPLHAVDGYQAAHRLHQQPLLVREIGVNLFFSDHM